MSAWALIMAAGSGTRMGLAGNKVLARLCGEPVLCRTVRAFEGLADGIVVVARAGEIEAVRALGLDAHIVAGGDTRQRSVLEGLRALPQDADIVLVHDGARPFVDADTIRRCIQSAQGFGSGVASVPVKDTIKLVDSENVVRETPNRAFLRAAQTPQAFCAAALRQAIEALEARGETATDDAGAMEAAGIPVRMVQGDYRNIKLTTPEDMDMAERMLQGGYPRVGHGYDVHRLVENRRLILCGIEVPYEKGLLGHSDADVALHALMDAMLGAAGMGDIGRHFPDTDMRYKDVSSMDLLREVVMLLAEKGYAVRNADITIAAQRPKLAPYIPGMVQAVADTLGIPAGQVNVKATTTEGLGFEGEGLGMSAQAVVLIG